MSTNQQTNSRKLTTSLNQIKSFDPCESGWKAILAGQGKTTADDVQFPLVDCLKSNIIADVLWLIGKRKVEIQIAVKFACMCADSVAHLNNRYSKSATAAATVANNAAANAAAYNAYAYAAANAAATAAANAAATAAYAAATAYATAAYNKQKELNKQFLLQCISDYEQGVI